MQRSRLFLLVLGATASACASSGRLIGRTEYAISADSLRHRLDDFSADSMLGRSYLDVGHDRATNYLAREAQRVGLEPAGENGGWFQTFHMFSRRLSQESRIQVGESTLVPQRDFKVFTFGLGKPRSFNGVRVIYGGIVGDTSTQIGADAASARIVLLGVPADMSPNHVYRNVGYGPTSRFGKAAAVVIASLDYLPLPQRAITPAVGILDPTTSRADAQPSTILVTRNAATLLLGGSLDGAVAGALGRIVVDLIAVEERDIPTRNVVAVLRGSDSVLARTFVALGAHSDHLGVRAVAVEHDSTRAVALGRRQFGEDASAAQIAVLHDSLMRLHRPRLDSIFNGADDDGSGSVALLEVARALSSGRRPQRSVLFVWHAAEEDDLVGSSWFVQHPTVPLDSIVAQINLDMVGRGGVSDIKNGGPRFLQVIGSTRRSVDLWPMIEDANVKAVSRFAIDTVDTEGAYCRSDHWSYAKFGIPVAFLTTGAHADYHAVTDEAKYIDYAKLTAVSQFTVDIVRALATRSARLSVYGPKPNPSGFCPG